MNTQHLSSFPRNLRCFAANCNMSRITRFLCYFLGLKFASVLFLRFFHLWCVHPSSRQCTFSLVGENITVYNIMILATQADRYCTWYSLIMWQCHCDTTGIWCHPKSKKLTTRRVCHKLFANVWRIFFHNLYTMYRFCVSAPCGTSFLYCGCQRGQCFTDHNTFHCQVHSDHSWIVGREN